MAYHPLNLTLRFLLELAALVAVGAWGWQQREDGLRFALAIGIPLLLAAAWGVFAVPDDPSRSGKAPLSVPGLLRLLFELAFFALAVWALYAIGQTNLGWIFGVVVVLHYLSSYDRMLWLAGR